MLSSTRCRICGCQGDMRCGPSQETLAPPAPCSGPFTNSHCHPLSQPSPVNTVAITPTSQMGNRRHRAVPWHDPGRLGQLATLGHCPDLPCPRPQPGPLTWQAVTVLFHSTILSGCRITSWYTSSAGQGRKV